MCHVYGIISYSCMELKIGINPKSLWSQTLNPEHISSCDISTTRSSCLVSVRSVRIWRPYGLYHRQITPSTGKVAFLANWKPWYEFMMDILYKCLWKPLQNIMRKLLTQQSVFVIDAIIILGMMVWHYYFIDDQYLGVKINFWKFR